MKVDPKITLVGAGPGDPELITVKGLKALQQADVILYDALANAALLTHASSKAICICVGKRSGKHSHKQPDIQMMMVQLAFKHGHVVRLKGGDPFVFGRGYEEMAYAKAFDIPVSIIPGISSAIAVPAAQEIAVTKRSIAESFWVVTATTKEGKLSKDVALAAQSSATIVILMGRRKLSQVVTIFKQLQRHDLPIMIIQNGTLPNEKVVVSSIDQIEKVAEEANIGTPALIVIGETVSTHPQFIQTVQSAVVRA
ncbi:MAG: uroporphyrinogen-III C-methyltransferase [Saprospiraceae bacterium]|nr:uroporphyrinogen-III C-methyltransferase [Saprospiraceae bacterium]